MRFHLLFYCAGDEPDVFIGCGDDRFAEYQLIKPFVYDSQKSVIKGYICFSGARDSVTDYDVMISYLIQEMFLFCVSAFERQKGYRVFFYRQFGYLCFIRFFLFGHIKNSLVYNKKKEGRIQLPHPILFIFTHRQEVLQSGLPNHHS